MLDWLEIRDFAIARRLELDLLPGLTVLTGETGSGKSLVVDALALLLGRRADTGVIRHGRDRSEIQGSFTLPPAHPAHRWLADQGLAGEGECLLRRVVQRNRAGRGFINGRAVPISSLRELGSMLVDIHGQHEHQSLLRRETQRAILDDRAGVAGKVAELGRIYRDMAELAERLQALDANAAASRERAELLRFQLRELDALDPGPDEWAELEQRHRRLGHLADLVEAAGSAAHRLSGDEEATVLQGLAVIGRRLEPFHPYDPAIEAALRLLDEAEVQIGEAAALLQRCHEQNELDPGEIAAIEERFSSWFELARRHRVGPEALAGLRETLRAELAALEDPDTMQAELGNRLAALHSRHAEIAADVSERRGKTARKFSRAVTAQMQELGMEGGGFRVALEPVAGGESSRFGNEQVEFLVTANPGQPLRPLSKVASGGELSRISLAIQVVSAGARGAPTLIFDEVDVGIGGRVAHAVGEKLRALGASRQVICVTHLAQVAARGEHHLAVRKARKGELEVIITLLGRKQRIGEIARMAGGSELDSQSLAHAEALLEKASADNDAA